MLVKITEMIEQVVFNRRPLHFCSGPNRSLSKNGFRRMIAEMDFFSVQLLNCETEMIIHSMSAMRAKTSDSFVLFGSIRSRHIWQKICGKLRCVLQSKRVLILMWDLLAELCDCQAFVIISSMLSLVSFDYSEMKYSKS